MSPGTTAIFRFPYPERVEIRDATDADWPEIYRFYSQIMDEGRTYAYPAGQSLGEARSWWMEPPPSRVTVAIEDEKIVGSAKMGPNRPGRGAHIATGSFLVDPASRRQGAGRALGEDAIGWCREQGYHGIQFNAVVEVNEPALRLWKALGFEVIGTVPEAFDHPDHGLVGLHVMYLRLS